MQLLISISQLKHSKLAKRYMQVNHIVIRYVKDLVFSDKNCQMFINVVFGSQNIKFLHTIQNTSYVYFKCKIKYYTTNFDDHYQLIPAKN